jgi:natural resistance-associated macrophage protein
LLPQVIGSAIALLLLSRGAVPLWAGVLLSVTFSFVMLLVERWGISKLEALFGLLISVMVGSFAVSGDGNWHSLGLKIPVVFGFPVYPVI